MKTRLTIVLALAAVSAFGQALCGSNGLTLTTTPPRLGDPYAITLSGSPNAPGLIGFDLAPGPVATPFGTVCLGLTPAFQYAPIALDAFGGYTTSGFLPANPALNGFGVFLQAAVADPIQPAGIALSNSVHPVLRPPRVFFIDYGIPGYGTPPGWVAYDALSDSVGSLVSVPAPIVDVVAVPALGWIAMVLSDGTLLAFDAATGAVTLNVPLVTNPTDGVQLTVSGTTLIVHEFSSSPGLPGVLRFVSLPLTGSPVSVTLPLDCFLITQAVNGYVYLIGSSTDLVFPCSVATGTLLPPISLSGGAAYASSYWVVHGNFIYILVGLGGGLPFSLNAIDTSTNTALLASPAPTPYTFAFGVDPLLRFGPGTNGPALFIRDMTSVGSYALAEISPQTLAVMPGSIPIPDIMYMEASNGGTEWLFTACSGCGSGGGNPWTGQLQTLYRMDATTHAVTTIGSLPNGAWARPSVLPSGTLNKAFVSTGGGVVRFDTDPTTSIIPVPLPISAPVYTVGLKVVID